MYFFIAHAATLGSEINREVMPTAAGMLTESPTSTHVITKPQLKGCDKISCYSINVCYDAITLWLNLGNMISSLEIYFSVAPADATLGLEINREAGDHHSG